MPPPSARLTFAAGTIVLEGMPSAEISRVLRGMTWAWDPRINAWRTDAMYYAETCERLAAAGFLDPRSSILTPPAETRERLPVASPSVQDEVPAWQPVVWPKRKIHPLRPEQQKGLDAWRTAGRGTIIMPTGTGKTEVALWAMAESGAATLVVAPVRDLMYQWHRRILAALGYDAGIVGDNVFRVLPVSVTTYDSACIHMERFGNQFQLLIFDECHHLPGAVRRDAARMSAAPLRMGLTATVERSDGRHVDLDELIGPVVYELPLAEVKGSTLADYEVIRIPVHLSPEERARYDELSQVVRSYMHNRRKEEPTFTWDNLCSETARTPEARKALKAYYAKKSIEDRAEEKLRVLEDIFRLHAGEPCLVFAGSNAMARDVSRRFLVPCLLNHCGKKERLEVLQGLADGSYMALVANQVLDEGVDLPEVKVAVVIGGTSSSRQAKQRLGRVLRKRGGSRAILYEIICSDTNEESRSRRRRSSDAYHKVRHRRGKQP